MALLLLADGASRLTLASLGGRLQLNVPIGIFQGIIIEELGRVKITLKEVGFLNPPDEKDPGLQHLIVSEIGQVKLVIDENGDVKTILNEIGVVT